MITAIVILSLLSLASIVFNVYGCRANNALKIENKTLHWKLRHYIDANNDCSASYHVQRIACEGQEHSGKWAVKRVSQKGGLIIQTAIKVFTDEDDDFNKREAEELCEILRDNPK